MAEEKNCRWEKWPREKMADEKITEGKNDRWKK